MSRRCPVDWRFTGDPAPLARDNIYCDGLGPGVFSDHTSGYKWVQVWVLRVSEGQINETAALVLYDSIKTATHFFLIEREPLGCKRQITRLLNEPFLLP